MKKLRQIHLYLGCIFAPMLICLALTGAWQLFSLHRGLKDNSYQPPRIVAALSNIHIHQSLPGSHSERPTPMRYFLLGAAVGLIVTMVLGIVMAFRFASTRQVVLCLIAGIVVPLGLLLLHR